MNRIALVILSAMLGGCAQGIYMVNPTTKEAVSCGPHNAVAAALLAGPAMPGIIERCRKDYAAKGYEPHETLPEGVTLKAR